MTTNSFEVLRLQNLPSSSQRGILDANSFKFGSHVTYTTVQVITAVSTDHWGNQSINLL